MPNYKEFKNKVQSRGYICTKVMSTKAKLKYFSSQEEILH